MKSFYNKGFLQYLTSTLKQNDSFEIDTAAITIIDFINKLNK